MADLLGESYDQTLIVRSQLGDEQAFRELLQVYGPGLLSFIRRRMPSAPHRVEDMVQEVWISIARGLPGLRDVHKFRSWAFRIAGDRVALEYRRHGLATDVLEQDEVAEIAVCPTPEPQVEYEKLQRGLIELTREHRQVIESHFLMGLSYEEIASRTGLALGTVRSRLFYGKRALKRALERKPDEPVPASNRRYRQQL